MIGIRILDGNFRHIAPGIQILGRVVNIDYQSEVQIILHNTNNNDL